MGIVKYKKLPTSLKAFVVTSMLVLVGIFLGAAFEKASIVGIAFTIWIVNFCWCLKTIMVRSGVTLRDFVDEVDNKSKEAKQEKKPFKRSIYVITLPMMVLGIIFVYFQILVLFNMEKILVGI